MRSSRKRGQSFFSFLAVCCNRWIDFAPAHLLQCVCCCVALRCPLHFPFCGGTVHTMFSGLRVAHAACFSAMPPNSPLYSSKKNHAVGRAGAQHLAPSHSCSSASPQKISFSSCRPLYNSVILHCVQAISRCSIMVCRAGPRRRARGGTPCFIFCVPPFNGEEQVRPGHV